MDTATIVAGLVGGGATVGIGALSFFVKRVVSDVRKNTQAIGNLKGKTDLIAQQQQNDIKRIEENTQLKLDQLTTSIQGLTDTVGTLVNVHIEERKK